MTFQDAPRWSPGTRLKCHIAAIGEKKSLGVFALIGGENRLPRWAYKIARCVVGLSYSIYPVIGVLISALTASLSIRPS